MDIPKPKTYLALRPLSIIYSAIMSLRNYLFDHGILNVKSYGLPVISVGNISVGGTGKTPHTEYLIRLLSQNKNIAVLSRGYKRKTSGYILADKNSSANEIGDEPWQIKNKFGQIAVAVDESRQEGIERILNDFPKTDAVILDDAMQHRYVKPSLSITLTDYSRLFTRDKVLPEGRLRESQSSIKRSDIIIVSKCPSGLDCTTAERIRQEIRQGKRQRIFFSKMDYGNLEPVFSDSSVKFKGPYAGMSVMMLTAIANPLPLEDFLKEKFWIADKMSFADHHSFSSDEIASINDRFGHLGENAIIVTTEKDAARLHSVNGLTENVRNHLFKLPIKVEFMFEQQETFDGLIIEHVNSFHIQNSNR